MYFWRPALAPASCKFASVCPSVLPQCKIAELAHQIFLIFLMKLESHEVSPITKPDFWKKFPSGQESPKSPQSGPKMRFLGLWEKSNSLICTFLLEYKYINGLVTKYQGKIWFLTYSPKTSRPIRIQDSLNNIISHTSWYMKLNICMWLDIHRRNKFTQLFQVGVVKFIPNSESASYQERVDLWSWFLHLVRDA